MSIISMELSGRWSTCLLLASLADLEKNCKLKESQTLGLRIYPERPEVKHYCQVIPVSPAEEEPWPPALLHRLE